MLQEIGIRSNLSLIVLTVIVVCLTVLYIIESRRINRELSGIKEKLHVTYEELMKLKGNTTDESSSKGKEEEKEEKEIPNEEVLTEEIPKEEMNAHSEDVRKEEIHPSKPLQTSFPKSSPQPNPSPLPTPIANPLLAMMMSGPPPGMVPVSITQNIEEWDDGLDQPQELLEEETETDTEKKLYGDNEEHYEEESSGEETDEDVSEDEQMIPDVSEIQISTDHVDSSYSVKQLQDICKKHELSYSGNKTQLVERINQFFKK